MRITGYESENGKVTAITVTDETRGFYDKRFEEERPHGEWVKGEEISRMMIANETLYIDYKDFTCSNCGLVLDRLLYHVDGSAFYKFCPNCGADMREGDLE